MNTDNKLLIADASSFDRAIMTHALRNTYVVLEANTGTSALEIFIKEIDNIKLAIIDISLPKMDGFEVLRHIKRMHKAKNIPIILTCTKAIRQNVVKAFSCGASDFILKPFESDFFRQRVLALLNHSSSVSEKALTQLAAHNHADVQVLKEYDITLNKIVKNLYMPRQIETPVHLKRVSLFTGVLLNALAKNHSSEVNLNEEQIALIIRASVYHDIGKLAIPDHILENAGYLSPEDKLIYNSHTVSGSHLLRVNTNPVLAKFVRLSANIAMYHHENWDGSGYPKGLKGSAIPLSAQVVGLSTGLDRFCSQFYGFTDNVFEPAAEKILTLQANYNPILLRILMHSESIVNKILEKYPDLT